MDTTSTLTAPPAVCHYAARVLQRAMEDIAAAPDDALWATVSQVSRTIGSYAGAGAIDAVPAVRAILAAVVARNPAAAKSYAHLIASNMARGEANPVTISVGPRNSAEEIAKNDALAAEGKGAWFINYSMSAVADGEEPPTAGPSGPFRTHAEAVASACNYSAPWEYEFRSNPLINLTREDGTPFTMELCGSFSAVVTANGTAVRTLGTTGVTIVRESAEHVRSLAAAAGHWLVDRSEDHQRIADGDASLWKSKPQSPARTVQVWQVDRLDGPCADAILHHVRSSGRALVIVGLAADANVARARLAEMAAGAGIVDGTGRARVGLVVNGDMAGLLNPIVVATEEVMGDAAFLSKLGPVSMVVRMPPFGDMDPAALAAIVGLPPILGA